MLQDLHKLHQLRPNTTFNNFFKSAGCKATLKYLESTGLPESYRLMRMPAVPGIPARALAHPLLALEFIRWMDHDLYLTRINSALGLDRVKPAE